MTISAALNCYILTLIAMKFLDRNKLIEELSQSHPEDIVRDHFEKMDESYFMTFDQDEIALHVSLVCRLGDGNLAEVHATPVGGDEWEVTIVAFDYMDELSTICGLFASLGFNIRSGDIFTYSHELIESERHRSETQPPAPSAAHSKRSRRRTISGLLRHRKSSLPTTPRGEQSLPGGRKIVDVFRVAYTGAKARRDAPSSADLWRTYENQLEELLRLLRDNEQHEVRGRIINSVCDFLRQSQDEQRPKLLPIHIAVDNTSSDAYTVVNIESTDTVAFLYELTNALSMRGIHIDKVEIKTERDVIDDTLFVTDESGAKITSENKIREIRAAAAIIKQFSHLLPDAPNPERALTHFGQFMDQMLSKDEWTDELALVGRQEVMDALARLLGVSDFLWEDFLRMQHENLFPILRDARLLKNAKTKDEMRAELDELLSLCKGATRSDSDQLASTEEIARSLKDQINSYKDREMFRIDMRHIMKMISVFDDFSAELTDLADVIIQAATEVCEEELQRRYGVPYLEDGSACKLGVCALGKCGGREIGYASDIELMFIYSGQGHTSGPEKIANSEYYDKLVSSVRNFIVTKREGIFEIDLRLRPYGKDGPLGVSLQAFASYFCEGGRAQTYERQALVRLRPITGDAKLGKQIETLRDEFVYSGKPFDIARMRELRQRQIKELVKPGAINAKFSPGGLVDLEYYVQILQLTHGARDASVRSTNTLKALESLFRAGYISDRDYTGLRKAYIFLRMLIDALRVVRGNAKDLTLARGPTTDDEPAEFKFLARRLGYTGDERQSAEAKLSRDIELYMKKTKDAFDQLEFIIPQR